VASSHPRPGFREPVVRSRAGGLHQDAHLRGHAAARLRGGHGRRVRRTRRH